MIGIRAAAVRRATIIEVISPVTVGISSHTNVSVVQRSENNT